MTPFLKMRASGSATDRENFLKYNGRQFLLVTQGFWRNGFSGMLLGTRGKAEKAGAAELSKRRKEIGGAERRAQPEAEAEDVMWR